MGTLHFLNTPLMQNYDHVEMPEDYDEILTGLEYLEARLYELDQAMDYEDEGKRELEISLQKIQECLNWYRSFKS